MRVLPFYTLAATDEEFIIYKKGALYRCSRTDEPLHLLCRTPMGEKRRLLCKFRVFDRLLRLTPRASILVDEETLLFSMAGFIYRVNLSTGLICEELRLRQGMNNPLAFTRIENVEGFNDGIVFGEYFSNNNHEEVNVWHRNLKGQWIIAFSFPANTIYHIHGIIPNKRNGEVLILSGDSDEESAIWIAKNNFQDVKYVLRGSQKYRSCVAFPYKDGYVYATDTAREENYLYYMRKESGGWIISELSRLPGPCIYGTKHGRDCYFSTSVEGDDTLSDMRYRFTYKLGAGVKSRYVHVLKLSEDGVISDVCRWKKDWLPMLLFQFGNCLYPYSTSKNLIVTPIAVKKLDGKSLIL